MIKENIEKTAAKVKADPENGTSNDEDKTPFLSPLLQRPVLLPMFISTSLMFFQQWSGVNAIIFYTVSIFKATDSDTIGENLATIVVGIVQFFATFGK